MKDIQFPVTLTFKISTLSNDYLVQDANGRTIAYVKQKMLKLIEDVSVFSDDSKTQLIYRIKANKWLDFSAAYNFTNAEGSELGKVVRKGWASLWKARYEIYDENEKQDLLIAEENAWIKVIDSVLVQIPIVGLVTGYIFNPSYIVTRPDGTQVVRLKKDPSFFGRKFTINKLAEFEKGEEERVILGLMMMILLERRRG